MEAVHADWKEYLNLLICEENHLKHMDEYHQVRHDMKCFDCRIYRQVRLTCFSMQFNKEARDTQDLLKRLETEISQKYNPEFKDVYQMEGLISELDVGVLQSRLQLTCAELKLRRPASVSAGSS